MDESVTKRSSLHTGYYEELTSQHKRITWKKIQIPRADLKITT